MLTQPLSKLLLVRLSINEPCSVTEQITSAPKQFTTFEIRKLRNAINSYQKTHEYFSNMSLESFIGSYFSFIPIRIRQLRQNQ